MGMKRERRNGIVPNCNECSKWKTKEIYCGREGEGIQKITYSKDENIKSVISKMPLKVTIKLGMHELDCLTEIAEKVDKLRNEHFTDVHFIVE